MLYALSLIIWAMFILSVIFNFLKFPKNEIVREQKQLKENNFLRKIPMFNDEKGYRSNLFKIVPVFIWFFLSILSVVLIIIDVCMENVISSFIPKSVFISGFFIVPLSYLLYCALIKEKWENWEYLFKEDYFERERDKLTKEEKEELENFSERYKKFNVNGDRQPISHFFTFQEFCRFFYLSKGVFFQFYFGNYMFQLQNWIDEFMIYSLDLSRDFKAEARLKVKGSKKRCIKKYSSIKDLFENAKIMGKSLEESFIFWH